MRHPDFLIATIGFAASAGGFSLVFCDFLDQADNV
jgi:hypothetical protein